MSKQDTEIQGTKTATEVEDPQRRELLTKASKLAVYTAPTLTALLFTVNAHGFSPPPPPAGSDKSGPPSAESMRKKAPGRRKSG